MADAGFVDGRDLLLGRLIAPGLGLGIAVLGFRLALLALAGLGAALGFRVAFARRLGLGGAVPLRLGDGGTQDLAKAGAGIGGAVVGHRLLLLLHLPRLDGEGDAACLGVDRHLLGVDLL